MAATNSLDGRFAQAWGGVNPDGVHINVLLAARGSATAAAMSTAFTSPSEGFTPILVCVGPDQPSYQTLYPPTIMLNKVAVETEKMGSLVAGACQVGIAQGVLDSVAGGLLEANQDTVVFVSLWVNPDANDDDAVRAAARRATELGVREAVNGRAPADDEQLARDRDTITHPFYNP
jgi:5,6,7,8-tetrahydromethanopterin hydro-lyase